jgi:ATP-dependent RNA circularization protein (DNA/RNA ligase family)
MMLHDACMNNTNTKFKIALPNGETAIRHTKFVDRVTGAIAVYNKQKNEWGTELAFDQPWNSTTALIERYSKHPDCENAQVVPYIKMPKYRSN